MLRRYSVRLWIYPWFMKYLNTPGTCERHRLGLNFQQNISDHLRVHSTKPDGLYITSVLLVLDWAERWVLCVAPYFFQVDAYSWMLAWLHFEYRSAFCCWCIYLLHYLTERIFVVENVSMMHSLKRLTSLKKKWMSSLEHQRPPPYLFHQQRETSHQVPGC